MQHDEFESYVWCIYTGQGKSGYVIWDGGRKFRYKLTTALCTLIKTEIEKTNNVPIEFLEIVLTDFFSIYLERISGGICRAELLPYKAPFDSSILIKESARTIAPISSLRINNSNKFLFLRRFDSILPSISIVVEAANPGEIIAVTPAGLSILSKLFQPIEKILNSRFYNKVKFLPLSHETWIKDIIKLSKKMTGVIIDVDLFHLRTGKTPTGLEVEMILSIMIPTNVNRVYLARKKTILPKYIPKDLVIKVEPTDILVNKKRLEIANTIRKYLNPDYQSVFTTYFEYQQKIWERVMALDDTK